MDPLVYQSQYENLTKAYEQLSFSCDQVRQGDHPTQDYLLVFGSPSPLDFFMSKFLKFMFHTFSIVLR